MDGVELADLHEPGAHALHDLAAGLEALAPVRLPFQQVARVQRVRAELEEPAELPRRRGRPEAELLHERDVFGRNERFERQLEGRVVGMSRDSMQGIVVAVIALILPDVHWDTLAFLSDIVAS